jgi:propanol-preferring alcohol dehydrogenase
MGVEIGRRLARTVGAEIAFDAKTQDPPAEIQKQVGGAHGVLVTAVSTIAFKQALGMLRRGGACALVGLPPGDFPVSIFDMLLNGTTIRGSIVGTRLDLEEALALPRKAKSRRPASKRWRSIPSTTSSPGCGPGTSMAGWCWE